VKVVLDTNVLLSAIFFGGIPGRLLAAWQSGEVTLVLSPDIFDEYRRVGQELSERYPELGGTLEPVLALLVMNATIVDVPPLDSGVSHDPDDDKFLACARASCADVVVSGDKHLLQVSGWQGIKVLTPRQFYERYMKKSGR